jgi:hypothetical protein
MKKLAFALALAAHVAVKGLGIVNMIAKAQGEQHNLIAFSSERCNLRGRARGRAS